MPKVILCTEFSDISSSMLFALSFVNDQQTNMCSYIVHRACLHHIVHWRLQYRVGRVAKNHHWQATTFAAAARVVSNTGKFDRGLTHLLHSELHWLDVPQRILHKLGVTVHRYLQGRAPQYLMNCCHPTSDVASRQRLRSSARHHLVVPRLSCSTLGRRAFSVAGPMAWNALPDDLRDPSLSAVNFRNGLKTHLFRNALGHSAH